MDSLPKLDTFAKPLPSSARNSYASTTDSNPRSSYTSISDGTISKRTSYSPKPEPLGRFPSFSRTSDSFIPDSVESTPVSSQDSSESPTEWTSQESMAGQASPDIFPQSAHSKSEDMDGPTALRGLQNVKDVLCVAFGAFDRYYISWEDNDGKFHQVSQKLPESLNAWLFPSTGETRHLPTLHVSFGSNDEFFASDQNGKFSSRDANLPNAVSTRSADATREVMRKKAYTVSSSRLPDNLQKKADESSSPAKLERRRTFLDGQPSPRAFKQTTVPLSLSLHVRRESRNKLADREQETILPNLPIHTRKDSRNETAKSGQSPPSPGMKIERVKLEPKIENSESQSTSSNQFPIAPSKPVPERLERRRGFLSGIAVRPSWPEQKVILANKERILRVSNSTAPKAIYVDAGVQTEVPDAGPYDHLGTISDQPILPSFQTPPVHSRPIGWMADFVIRGQYSLGDALRFV